MVPSGAHEGAIPEGYAVIDTICNTPQPVWISNIVPVLYADHGWFEWQLQPTLSRHLVPTRNPLSPHGGNNVVMQERPFSPASKQLAEGGRAQPNKQPFFKKEPQRIEDSASEGSDQEQDGQPKVWRILRREDHEKNFPTHMQMMSSVESNELNTKNSVTGNPTPTLVPDDPRLKTVVTKEPKNVPREILNDHSEPASHLASLVGEPRGKEKSGDRFQERVSEKTGQEFTDENQFQKSTKSNEKTVQDTTDEKTVQETELLANEKDKFAEPLRKNKKKKRKSRSKLKASSIALDKEGMNEARETEEK
ncbi:hypothetical protein PCANC_11496 [Puccinia coronata f. sp. avenae]|uniref:Uncharacterized protein n=1 Tax=Puccinia coronata f. sp. avenae TaxID=200324 RepID=A0A2N5UVL1_9BASI|nr:hypothetical protein PCANC_11496 [Puccinia coronata f. sp. avenae]